MRRKIISTIFIILVSTALFAQSADDLNRSGVQKIQSGNYQAALDDFEEALLKADVNAARVYHNMALSYEKQGNLKRAAENYEEAIRRNPQQIQSYERGGYVHYSLQNYTKAVKLGRTGMKLDPDNREIPRWLDTAHRKSYKQEKRKLFPSTTTLQYPPPWQFRFGCQSTLIGAISTDPYGFSLKGNEGWPVNVPYLVYLEYIYKKRWGGRITAGNPYFGALLPHTLSLHERVETYYKKGNSYIGGGLLVSHYTGSQYTGSSQTLHDVKIGFVYGYHGKQNRIDLYFYPRFLPSDTGYGKDYTMDVSLLDVQWIRAFNHSFDLYGAFSRNEFYYFDNKQEISHYDGTYDFSAGTILDNRVDSLFTVYLYLTERIYMQNHNNESPYDALNGQGFFGIDSANWFKGDPFSGIRTFSHILNVRFEHNFGRHWKLYEKIGLEFTGTKETRHDITAKFGIEGKY